MGARPDGPTSFDGKDSIRHCRVPDYGLCRPGTGERRCDGSLVSASFQFTTGSVRLCPVLVPANGTDAFWSVSFVCDQSSSRRTLVAISAKSFGNGRHNADAFPVQKGLARGTGGMVGLCCPFGARLRSCSKWATV